MSARFLFCLIFSLFSVGVYAQDPIEVLIPGYCKSMSKNPHCWQEQENTKLHRSTKCRAKSSCEVIKNLHQDERGQYHCISINGNIFSCNKLVKQFGIQLEGFVTKVTVPNFDGCHMPGECGPKACVPGYGIASFDQACPQ